MWRVLGLEEKKALSYWVSSDIQCSDRDSHQGNFVNNENGPMEGPDFRYWSLLMQPSLCFGSSLLGLMEIHSGVLLAIMMGRRCCQHLVPRSLWCVGWSDLWRVILLKYHRGVGGWAPLATSRPFGFFWGMERKTWNHGPEFFYKLSTLLSPFPIEVLHG